LLALSKFLFVGAETALAIAAISGGLAAALSEN
jgi:hypothetical protein